MLDMTAVLDLIASQRLGDVRKLDLGSGPTPAPGYFGVDEDHSSRDVLQFNLASGVPWPFADGSIEALYSSHFIEHVRADVVAAYEFVTQDYTPGAYADFSARLRSHLHVHSAKPMVTARFMGLQDALCWVMDEAYRVTQPGGRFRLRWPSLKFEQTGELSVLPFIDPTHRRFIPLEMIELYFSKAGRAANLTTNYRIRCDWQLETQHQRTCGMGWEYDVTLVKPLAESD